MHFPTETFNRILSSPNLFFGIRQGCGVLLPVIIFIGFLHNYAFGFAFAAGALALAIVDQPGGTKRYRRNEMLFTLIVGNLMVLLTGLIREFPAVSWLVVSAQVFACSMLSVFGKRGGLVGFACLLMMLLSLSTNATFHDPWKYSLVTLSGSAYYFILSTAVSYLFRLREERLTLSAALFATAKYMQTRGYFYDTQIDLEDSFKRLLTATINMTDSQQSARDNILRNLPEDHKDHQRQRIVLWNVFVNMIALLDTMAATQTDYELLRKRFGNQDIMLFFRDTMMKLSRSLERCALKLARHTEVKYRSSVKAELRAIEYELVNFKSDGMATQEPEIYALLVQILRRLRNANHFVEAIADNLRDKGKIYAIQSMHRDKSLLQFRTHQNIRLQPILDNLHMQSAIFRYSLRVTLAVLIVQLITNGVALIYGNIPLVHALVEHSHWITITILITMRPGFALTRQRTIWRLQGTLVACLLVLTLFSLIDNQIFYLILMIVCMVLGQVLVQTHFRLASVLITSYVLIGFHFLVPSIYTIIGERAIDTVLAGLLAYICSFTFPWWEESQVPRVVAKTIDSSQDYLHKVRLFVRSAIEQGQTEQEQFASNPLYIQLQLARRDMHNSYAEFADSYARMMNEPKNHRINFLSVYKLLTALNTLAMQINSIGPLLLNFKQISQAMHEQINYIDQLIDKNVTALPPTPANLEDTPENHAFMLPLRQMRKAAQTIRQEAHNLGIMPLVVENHEEQAVTA